MKRVFIFLLLPLLFLSASCNPFKKPSYGGLLKTVNGGTDWLAIDTIKGTTTTNLSAFSFGRLTFDPTNRETLYAGSLSGSLFKSTDSGASWQQILSKIYVYDIAISPVNPRIIYAAGFYGDHGKVIKTTDGGATWLEVFNEETTGVIVRAVALNPTAPNQLIIGTSSGEVDRSDDEGASWRLVKDFKDRVNEILWQNGSVYVLAKTTGLFKSGSDLGSFTQLAGTLLPNNNFFINSNSNSVGTFNQVYIDSLNPSLMYLTTDKGLYKSVNEGQTWTLLNLPVKDYGLYGAYAVAVAKTSSNIIFTSVGSTIYKSTDGGNNWQTQRVVTGNLVYYILIDPQLPQIAYAGVYILPQ